MNKMPTPGFTYRLLSPAMRLIVSALVASVGLMASQSSGQVPHRASEKKPIVIDVRSGKSSGSIEAELYLVDGVLRRFDPSTEMDKLLRDSKHSVQALTNLKSTHSKSVPINGESQGDSLSVNLLASMIGQETGDWFGLSVAGVDDFNGDGYDDFVVGGPSNWGDVYIFYGGEEIDTIPDVWIKGDYSFGWSVAGAGDVNSDGYGDVVVGEDMYGPPSQAGAAYIFFGGPMTGEYIIFEGDQEELNLGADVASLGDINDDGYDDIIVGTGQNHGSGRAYVYFGGSVMDTIPDLILKGEHHLDYFGRSVSSSGDVNGDGAPDIIVGTGQIRVEKAYIYFGGILLDTIPDLIFTGPLDSDFGWRVGSAGDINGNGYDDSMVSAHWYTEDPGTTPPGYGRAYIYHGGAAMDTVPDVILSGTSQGAVFGLFFSTLGDINLDEYDGVIVSAHGGVGNARVFLGGLNLCYIDTLADVVIVGEAAGDHFSYFKWYT